ncbi:Voltage-dependent L-type calcium channel subunit alpha-1D [Symbiodinium microadriaticum]|uniref:Voltage-dependent L-type calcium channel subunit alpha-1D n=1 Tax=Symbiodinium microadriaticum TaxID=2951 RepID=A0A1Q9ERP0_SYMMI|nr:Voltage-dependent L-type calcium channel subunit alpha-1D [Symbiodinium microadriaticum]
MSETDDTPRKMVSLEEEAVEPPPPANAVRPGHLWCESARNGEKEAVRSFPDIHTGQQPIRSLLKEIHSDICNRLDRQDEAINRIHVIRGPMPMPAPKTPSSHVTEASSMASSLPLDDMNDAPIGSPTFHRYSLRPRLFSTFQDYDTALWDMATNADARNSRARFAAQKSGEGEGSSLERSGVSRRVSNIVKRPCFDMICALAVITNSLFLGIEVEMSKSYPSGLPLTLVVIQYLYAWWFTTELALRIVADGRHFFCSEDWAWGFLDVFVVITSLWEIVTDIYLAVQEDGMGDVNSMTGLRAFRIVRITRIVKARPLGG